MVSSPGLRLEASISGEQWARRSFANESSLLSFVTEECPRANHQRSFLAHLAPTAGEAARVLSFPTTSARWLCHWVSGRCAVCSAWGAFSVAVRAFGSSANHRGFFLFWRDRAGSGTDIPLLPHTTTPTPPALPCSPFWQSAKPYPVLCPSDMRMRGPWRRVTFSTLMGVGTLQTSPVWERRGREVVERVSETADRIAARPETLGTNA